MLRSLWNPEGLLWLFVWWRCSSSIIELITIYDTKLFIRIVFKTFKWIICSPDVTNCGSRLKKMKVKQIRLLLYTCFARTRILSSNYINTESPQQTINSGKIDRVAIFIPTRNLRFWHLHRFSALSDVSYFNLPDVNEPRFFQARYHASSGNKNFIPEISISARNLIQNSRFLFSPTYRWLSSETI